MLSRPLVSLTQRLIPSSVARRFQPQHEVPRAVVARVDEAQIIRDSGLFDADWFRDRYLAVTQPDTYPPDTNHPDTNPPDTDSPDTDPADTDPITHYVTIGARLGQMPHPLFDPDWYQRNNAEMAASNLTPLTHYILAGAAAGSSPHPLFDPAFYRQHRGEALQPGTNPLHDFVTQGFRARVMPHPLFDLTYYLAQVPELAGSDINPLTHFVAVAAARGLSPNRWFDPSWYVSAYKDQLRPDEHPFLHFLRVGAKEHLYPHPRADLARYQQMPDVPSDWIGAYIHLVQSGYDADNVPLAGIPVADQSTGGDRISAGPDLKTLAGHVPVNDDLFDLGVDQLRAVAIAQRWDIAGLTEQREAYFADSQRLAAANVAVEAIVRGQRTTIDSLARRENELHQQISAVKTNLNALLSVLHSVAMPTTGRRALIVASGLFDPEYYVAAHQLPEGMTDPLDHYLIEGDALGYAPNPLFDPDHYRRLLADHEANLGVSLVHYIRHGWQLGLAPHPLFDPAYYKAQQELPDDVPPWLHLAWIGAAEGASPHPLFDTGYYRSQRGIVTNDTASLVRDFLLRGWRDGVSPHPLFDFKFYQKNNPDISWDDENALIHYIVTGDAENLAPCLMFDPAYYRRMLAAVGRSLPSGTTTLANYCVHDDGGTAVQPHPLFDGRHYFDTAPDVRAAGDNALAHFMRCGWAEGRSPHPIFDCDHLRRCHPEIFRGSERNLLEQFIDDPRCRNLSPSLLFDPQYYLEMYPEVRQSELGPYMHFLCWGAQEGRRPHRLFDPTYYEAQVGDWRQRSPDPISDFLQFGAAKGASPHPLFDLSFYLETYSDIRDAGVNAFVHYMEFGGHAAEHRLPHPLFDARHYLRHGGGSVAPDRTLLEDFMMTPIRELINPHPLFDCSFFLSQRPDLVAKRINPLIHYVLHGAAETVNPHPLFLQDYYRKQCDPSAMGAINPLLHFCTIGYREGLRPHPAFDTAYVLEQREGMLADNVNPLAHYLEERPFIHHPEPNRWFDTISYNIVHQNGRQDVLHPLLDLVQRVDLSEIPDPTAVPTSCADVEGPGGVSSTREARRPSARALVDVFRGLSAIWNGSIHRGSVFARDSAPPTVSCADKVLVGEQGDMLQAFRDAVTKVVETLRKPDATDASNTLSTAAVEEFLRSQDIHCAGRLHPSWPKRRRGVALYAIYAPQGRLSLFHRDMLAALRARDYAIILINSSLAGGAEFRADALAGADLVIQRRGGGRDFGSWVSVMAMYYDLISAFDHVLFVNDSLLGPVDSLDPLWTAFEASTAPVWGLTESIEIRRHLQSSFFIMRRSIVQSATMIRFMANFGFPDDRRKVVRQGELGLAAELASDGIPFEAMVSYQDVSRAWFAGSLRRQRWFDELAAGNATSTVVAQVPAGAEVAFAEYGQDWTSKRSASLRQGEPINPQHAFWDILCTEFRYPFIKRELLAANPLKVPSVVRLPEILAPSMRARVLRGLEEQAQPSTSLSASIFWISRQTVAAWLAAVEHQRLP